MMQMKRGKCRIWWPKQLLSCKPDYDLLLFGWFFHSTHRFFDVVVATAASPNQLTSPHFQSNPKVQNPFLDLLHYFISQVKFFISTIHQSRVCTYYIIEKLHDPDALRFSLNLLWLYIQYLQSEIVSVKDHYSNLELMDLVFFLFFIIFIHIL